MYRSIIVCYDLELLSFCVCGLVNNIGETADVSVELNCLPYEPHRLCSQSMLSSCVFFISSTHALQILLLF
ncbi:Uncharacterized protein TCM_042336 [Theobroma cacao]|uniref:Uncharacterized protein n=1 Tax=Theobroma cacao TaxID=3641 RepID=A0A061FSK7_THECC|nr:Uncharacterized protein TCM_042336 [Theobroma cacao]